MKYNDFYRCVLCGNNALIADHTHYACTQCETIFPIISGIKILLPRPKPLLWAMIRGINEINSRLSKIRDHMEVFTINTPESEFVTRAHLMIEGINNNLALMNKHCHPIIEYLSNEQPQDDILAWTSVQTGFSYHDMLPYFYQDWFGTPDFKAVKSLFTNAMREHCSDKSTVAVLGAGACGLLYAVSECFELSFGVDLSLPTLLTAKRLIEGEPITVHLERAEWKKVILSPPSPPSNEICFVVSNVMNLPLHDASLSAVVSQYVTEVNQVGLANEIHRVLKPRGLWIDFSPGFNVPGDPVALGPRKPLEIKAWLGRQGFEVIEVEKKRFRFLNLDEILPGGDCSEHEVHFFVASKCDVPQGRCLPQYNTATILERDDVYWQRIPIFTHGKEIQLVTRKTFTRERADRQLEISVMGYSFFIPEEYACFLETFFKYVGGNHNLYDIYTGLCAEGLTVKREEFLQLIHCLSVENNLIDLE